MRRAHRIGSLVIGALGLVAAAGQIAAAQSRPSLAEVARQEAERRKTLTTQARVYTNADLKHARPLTTAAAAPAPAPAQASQGASAAPPTDEKAPAAPDARAGAGTGAEVLAKRLLSARDDLAQARAAFDEQQLRVTMLTADWVGAPDEATRASIASARDVAAAEAERLRGEIDSLAKALAQLEQDVLEQVRAAPGPK